MIIIRKRNNRLKAIFAMVVMLIGIIGFGHTSKSMAASQAESVANYALSQVGTKERSSNSDNIIYND